jgi:carbamoyltransferase
MAGGVALNCVANGVLAQKQVFKSIYIQPAAGDAGGALGAALAVTFMYYNEPRVADGKMDAMYGSYLGPSFSDKEVTYMNRRNVAVYRRYENFDDLATDIAARLDEGNVVGWFQGRMEFGPRALGNRSILGDARKTDMQKKLNLKIKYREGFRPFAPSVLAEEQSKYFDLEPDSPYMLLVAPVKEEWRCTVPGNYWEMPLMDRLYQQRSSIQAVTHIDFSARIQSVHRETNERYWKLISAFNKLTGCGLIVNTSFNVRGEPIVCNPFDAYRCFMATEMDYLVINNYVYCKTEQPDWQNKEKWQVSYQPD